MENKTRKKSKENTSNSTMKCVEDFFLLLCFVFDLGVFVCVCATHVWIHGSGQTKRPEKQHFLLLVEL